MEILRYFTMRNLMIHTQGFFLSKAIAWLLLLAVCLSSAENKQFCISVIKSCVINMYVLFSADDGSNKGTQTDGYGVRQLCHSAKTMYVT